MSLLGSPVGAVAPADWNLAPLTSASRGSKAAPASPPVPAAVTLPDPQQQAQFVAQQLQEFLRDNGHEMQFSVDKVTGMTIVRIYNIATGELVRQVPSEEIVHIAQVLRQEAGRSTLSVRA